MWRAKLCVVIAVVVVTAAAAGAELTEKGTIGPEAESWVHEYPLVVSEDARDVVVGENVHLDQGIVRFELLDPQGSLVVSHQGKEFSIGPQVAAKDVTPGEYKLRVTAEDAIGKWQVAAATADVANSTIKYLMGGVLMIVVAAASVVFWRLKSGALWRWFWAGALLWAIGVAMKFGFAIPMNGPILKWLEGHSGHTGYLIFGCVYIGLLTGVFEIGIVALMALKWRGMAAEARNAVAVGVGAGAIEAALLGLGLVAATASALAQPDSNYMAAPLLMAGVTPVAWLAAPVERVIAILCHIAGRTLALLGVARNSLWPFGVGFGLMSLVDAIAAWAYLTGTLGSFSVWWLELALVPLAVVSVPLTVWAVRHWPVAESSVAS